MFLVYDDETEARNGGKKGGARADDNPGGIGREKGVKDKMALCLGLLRVNKGDEGAKIIAKNPNKLAGKGDFWH